MLMPAPAVADEVALSARVWSAVLVREGPLTISPFLVSVRACHSAALVGEMSGWYIVELADGARGNPPASEPRISAGTTIFMFGPLLPCRLTAAAVQSRSCVSRI